MENVIKTYLQKTATTQKDFSVLIGVSPSMVKQYIDGVRPVSEKMAVRIEIKTNGLLNRKTLRPNDWMDIWPELAGKQFNGYG